MSNKIRPKAVRAYDSIKDYCSKTEDSDMLFSKVFALWIMNPVCNALSLTAEGRGTFADYLIDRYTDIIAYACEQGHEVTHPAFTFSYYLDQYSQLLFDQFIGEDSGKLVGPGRMFETDSEVLEDLFVFIDTEDVYKHLIEEAEYHMYNYIEEEDLNETDNETKADAL